MQSEASIDRTRQEAKDEVVEKRCLWMDVTTMMSHQLFRGTLRKARLNFGPTRSFVWPQPPRSNCLTSITIVLSFLIWQRLTSYLPWCNVVTGLSLASLMLQK
jgi:hypothetical protein